MPCTPTNRVSFVQDNLSRIKALPPMCLHACDSEVLHAVYFEMMFSGVHEDIIIKLIYVHETKGPKRHRFH